MENCLGRSLSSENSQHFYCCLLSGLYFVCQCIIPKPLKVFGNPILLKCLYSSSEQFFFFGNVGFSFLLWTFTNLTPISFSTCTSFVQDSGVCYCCCQEFIAPCICSLLLHVFVLLKEKFMCNKQPG